MKRHQKRLTSTPIPPKICGRRFKMHSLQKQGCPHHVWGHATGLAEHILCSLDPKQRLSCKSTLPPEYWPLSVTTVDVRKILLRLNIDITAGPDNLSGYILKTLTNQLADITADIFNNSHKTLPSCLKRAIIVTATKQCLGLITCALVLSPRSRVSVLRNRSSSIILASLDTNQYAFRNTAPQGDPHLLPFTQFSCP